MNLKAPYDFNFIAIRRARISQIETLPTMNHVTQGRSIHRMKLLLSIAWLRYHRCGFGSPAFSRIAS